MKDVKAEKILQSASHRWYNYNGRNDDLSRSSGTYCRWALERTIGKTKTSCRGLSQENPSRESIRPRVSVKTYIRADVAKRASLRSKIVINNANLITSVYL
jgi:hypothetical protein